MRNQEISCKLLLLVSLCGLLQITLTSPDNDPYYRILTRGKPASQSSTEGSHVASLATDGNFDDDESKCAKTTTSDNPYLEVDLGEDTFVNVAVFVLPGAQKSYTNIQVTFTSADGSTVHTPINNKDQKNKFFSMLRRTIRHIKITRLASGTQLSVCEVAVYKLPIENIAARKSTDSARDVLYAAPYRAVDTSLGSKFATKVLANPWFRVDLREVYLVHEIFIIVVLEYSEHGHMLDLNLRIGDSLHNEGNSNPLCTTASLFLGEARSFYCDMFGQFVNIHRQVGQGDIRLSEVYVNTYNAESVPSQEGTISVQTKSGNSPAKALDLQLNTWLISKVSIGEKRLRVELAGEYNIVMIYIVAKELKKFELKLGMHDQFALQTHCVPGLHDMPGWYNTKHFFCEERTRSKYIHLHQYVDILMEISEIAAYEESKPIVNHETTPKNVWAEEHKDTTVSCDINGYPTPVFSWVKDGNIVGSGSRSWTLVRARHNDSGLYVCRGNNAHGYDAKRVKIRVASKFRICVVPKEMDFDLRTSSVVKDHAIRGDLWYTPWDSKTREHLQFRETASESSYCELWLTGKHPSLEDGVVRGTLCVKNNTHDCTTTIPVDIRRCAANHIYHFPTLRETAKHKFCFQPASISTNSQQPLISSAVPNHALSDVTFKTEMDVSEPHQCFLMCQLAASCKSFNFSQKQKTCELNTATRRESPRNYGPRNEFSYYQMSGGGIKVVPGGEL